MLERRQSMLFTSLSAFTSAQTVTGCILKWETNLLFCFSRRRAGAVRSLLVEEDTPSTVRVSWSQTVWAAAVLLTTLHRQSAHLKQTFTPDMWPSPPTVVFKAETWAGTWEWKLGWYLIWYLIFFCSCVFEAWMFNNFISCVICSQTVYQFF